MNIHLLPLGFVPHTFAYDNIVGKLRTFLLAKLTSEQDL